MRLKQCFLFLLLYSNSLWAQNLVPNFNFDQITECPDDKGQISFARPWYPSNGKTTDLIHTCDKSGVASVPDNKWGSQFPFSGSGMAGIRVYLEGEGIDPNYREYLAVELTAPLIKDEKYFISFKASPGENNRYYSENISLHLSSNRIPSSPFLDLEPTITNRTGLLNAFNAWYDISGEYVAEGGEKYLVIGNFENDENTRLVDQFQPEGKDLSAYYFIDHVVVQPCSSLWPQKLIDDSVPELCPRETIELKTNLDQDQSISFFWQDSLFGDNLIVTEPGLYTLTASYQGVCTETDTVSVESAGVQPDLGPDTLLCPGEILEIELPEDPETSYRWSDGSKAAVKIIEGSGTYWVEAKTGNCVLSDTLEVNSVLSEKLELEKDTIICENQQFLLDADVGTGDYQWNTGETNPRIQVDESGLYRVFIQSSCFNGSLQFFVVEKNCDCSAKIPNVITPNKDGFNEEWQIELPEDVKIRQISLYNRWGKKIFTGNHPRQLLQEGSKESELSSVPYYYMLEIECFSKNGQQTTKKFNGTLTILK